MVGALGAFIGALALISAQSSQSSNEWIARRLVAETAIAQLRRIDPGWQPSQRDCAGLVRFAYREAFRRLSPERITAGLWRDRDGGSVPFADAETLLASNFQNLGRADDVRAALRSGDLLAFRQERGAADEAYHLMIVIRPDDRAHLPARVVYHPGTAESTPQTGTIDALVARGAAEWRPVRENRAFLGYFRWKEWVH